jgi:transcriptional regulator with XRE-family HTH domain
VQTSGLTLDRLGRRIGCSKQSLSAYQNGERAPSAAVIVGLTREAGVPERTDALLSLLRRDGDTDRPTPSAPIDAASSPRAPAEDSVAADHLVPDRHREAAGRRLPATGVLVGAAGIMVGLIALLGAFLVVTGSMRPDAVVPAPSPAAASAGASSTDASSAGAVAPSAVGSSSAGVGGSTVSSVAASRAPAAAGSRAPAPSSAAPSSAAAPVAAPVAGGACLQRVVDARDLYLRDADGKPAGSQLLRGDRVTITDRHGRKPGLVAVTTADGRTGWVLVQYLKAACG